MAVQRIVLRRPGHPLAAGDGRVHRNRLVLYDKIGPGPHKCHWCPQELRWYSKLRPCEAPPDYLAADHIDRNPRNDTPENLTASCIPCNLRRRQDRNPILAQIKAIPNKRGTRKGRYKRISMPGHPLADCQGCVAEHRLVLWDKIGPGEHKCRWCDRRISWDATIGSRDPRPLVPDHLDGNRLNNAPENLVEACNPCNVMRGRSDRVQDDELFITKGNARFRVEERACLQCGKTFQVQASLIKHDPGRNGKFCSRSCCMSHTLSRQHGHTSETLFGYNKRGQKFKAEERVCQECGKRFLFAMSMAKYCPGKFCSKSCSAKHNGRLGLIGNHLPESADSIPARGAHGNGRRLTAIHKLCEQCGKDYLSLKKEHKRFCDRNCYFTYRGQHGKEFSKGSLS